VFKYNYGLELFFFTIDSPYHGLALLHCWGARSAAKQARSFHDFWTKPHVASWRLLAWALYERC